jgi:phosphate/sulfate permease
MWKFIAVLSILGFLGAALKLIGTALYIIFIYVVLPVCGFWVLYAVVRSIYHTFNPEAKRAYLERKVKEAEESRKRKEQEEVVVSMSADLDAREA